MELLRTLLTVAILMLYCYRDCNMYLKSEFFTLREDVKDEAYSHNLIDEVQVRGRMECFSQCLENSASENCSTVSYNSDMSLCRLFDNQHDNNETVDYRGWQNWSVFRGCGRPPEVPHADVTYGADFLYAVASYTCKPDFKPCSIQTESRCQASGEWTAISDLCSRFRWHNPVVPFEESLPCQDKDMMHIKIKATPTAEIRMSFQLKGESETLLLIDCRFNYFKDVRQIVLNTYIHGTFGLEIRPSGFPFTVNESFLMEITRADVHYKISVGEQAWTFNDRTGNATPTQFVIQSDIDVEEVEISVT